VADFAATPLLATDTVAAWDVKCPGATADESPEECASATHFVFPYRGVYVHHVGRKESIADASQVVVINDDEPYRVSHPVGGGDSSLSIGVSAATLMELLPTELLQNSGRATLNQPRLRVDAHAQARAAVLRHRLRLRTIEGLEAETLTLDLIRHAVGQRFSGTRPITETSRRLVDHAKLVVSSDLRCRRTLADLAAEVGVSPTYLTDVFQRVEGTPLYRYQLQLRLARALDLLGEYDDVTELALALGFSSHSHFSAAFKQTYGHTPSAFRRASGLR
jgi:AraC-like DNA-binding protein